MNGFDLIAQCLKAEGVTWMGCFPANPLIESGESWYSPYSFDRKEAR